MFVIKLPNGNLMAPESAVDAEGPVLGDAYVEVSPADPEYSRLARQAVSPEELARRREQWRQQDAALRQEFERYRAQLGEQGPPGEPPPGPPRHPNGSPSGPHGPEPGTPGA